MVKMQQLETEMSQTYAETLKKENTLQLSKLFKVFFGNGNVSKICGIASKKNRGNTST